MAKKSTQKTPPPVAQQTVALVDAFSLFFKAFFAIRSLSNKDGLPTNAVYGFIRMLQKVLNERCPEYIAVALESPTVTFRSEIHEQYKANRPDPPGDLVQQIPWLEKVLHAWGLKAVQHESYEADDVIGTLARRAERDGLNVWIVSADKDLFQLVTDRIKFLRFENNNEIEVYGPAEVEAKMGVRPDQMVDYLALVGDSSDNIPGVPKIGPKTAVELLREFGTLENLLANAEQIKNARWRELLRAGEDSARLSRRLACICETIPMEMDWESMRWHRKMSTPAFVEVCRELGFRTLVEQAEQTPPEEPADMLSGLMDAEANSQTPFTPQATHYTLICDQTSLDAFVNSAKKAELLAISVETAKDGGLVGLSLSIEPSEAVYIPLGHRAMGDEARQLSAEAVRQTLGPLLADPALPKTGHNLKNVLKVLRANGLDLQGIAFDTAIAQYLLDADANQNLDEMSRRLLQYEQRSLSDLLGTGKGRLCFEDVAVDAACDYACQDSDVSLRLTHHLRCALEKAGVDSLMREIEIPLLSVLADMEQEGVRLDVPYLRELSHRMRAQLKETETKIFEVAGHPFNISSSRQVADVLFEEIKLKPQKSGKTGYSTDISVLETLADEHPLPNLLLQYRGYEKLLSTYVDTLPQMVNPRTGRLHCCFGQTVAATGRLSCSDPNLQNIPVRSEDGKAIRRAFLPNGEDELLLAADYNQIELRILAHLTQDEALSSAFQQDQDIHLSTASRIFRCEPSAVTSLMRSQAKVVNFGVLYGMTAMRLSNECKISRQAAQKFIDDYFAAYPKVRQWIEGVLQDGRDQGYVRTLAGRVRKVPGLKAPSAMARKAEERIAINTPVQGTAADMIKIAMVNIARRLKQSNLRARMILQIHDELIFTTPRNEAEALEALVTEEMENALPLSVPVRVNTCTGSNWAEV